MKKTDELISDLQEWMRAGGEHVPDIFDLIEMAYGERVAREHKARHKMVLDACRAKVAAGYPRTCRFFSDVWPDALEALIRQRNAD
jgi:hypothetical protein